MIKGTIMKKSTKGALAAAAAGSLLLGGAGSLAYWTDASTISGSSIGSGHLKLTPAAAGCDAWQLGGSDFNTGTETIVPGDTLTRHCSYTADMAGTSLTATVDVSTPSFTGGGLAPALTPSATYAVAGGSDVNAGTPTTIGDGDSVDVDITVSFPRGTGVDNTYNRAAGLTAALGAITVTATQS